MDLNLSSGKKTPSLEELSIGLFNNKHFPGRIMAGEILLAGDLRAAQYAKTIIKKHPDLRVCAALKGFDFLKIETIVTEIIEASRSMLPKCILIFGGIAELCARPSRSKAMFNSSVNITKVKEKFKTNIKRLNEGILQILVDKKLNIKPIIYLLLPDLNGTVRCIGQEKKMNESKQQIMQRGLRRLKEGCMSLQMENLQVSYLDTLLPTSFRPRHSKSPMTFSASNTVYTNGSIPKDTGPLTDLFTYVFVYHFCLEPIFLSRSIADLWSAQRVPYLQAQSTLALRLGPRKRSITKRLESEVKVGVSNKAASVADSSSSDETARPEPSEPLEERLNMPRSNNRIVWMRNNRYASVDVYMKYVKSLEETRFIPICKKPVLGQEEDDYVSYVWDLPNYLTSKTGSSHDEQSECVPPVNFSKERRCRVQEYLDHPIQRQYFECIDVNQFLLPPAARVNYCRYEQFAERVIKEKGDIWLEEYSHSAFHQPSAPNEAEMHAIYIDIKPELRTLYNSVSEDMIKEMDTNYNAIFNRRMLFEMEYRLAYLKRGLTPPQEIIVLSNNGEIVSRPRGIDNKSGKYKPGKYIKFALLSQNFRWHNMQPAIKFLYPKIEQRECQLLNLTLNVRCMAGYRFIFYKQFRYEQEIRKKCNIWTDFRMHFARDWGELKTSTMNLVHMPESRAQEQSDMESKGLGV